MISGHKKADRPASVSCRRQEPLTPNLTFHRVGSLWSGRGEDFWSGGCAEHVILDTDAPYVAKAIEFFHVQGTISNERGT